MPLAVVLELTAIHSGQYHNATGKGVHGWWFHRWETYHPEKESELHEPNRVSSFTLSSLQGLPQPDAAGVISIEAGQPAWLRFTVLDEELEMLILKPKNGWLAKLPPTVTVADLSWHIQAVHTTPAGHPWAGRTAYAQLRTLLDLTSPPAHWLLEVASPLAFNGGKSQFPFPNPDLVIRSLLQRWNVFSPDPLPEELIETARQSLVFTQYALHTETIKEGKAKTIGCVGQVGWRAVDMHPALRLGVNLLLDYAFYAGVGYHTTRGMGQTRLLKRGV